MVDPPPYECDAARRCAEAAPEDVPLQGVLPADQRPHDPASADVHVGAVPAIQGRGRIPLLHLLQPGVLWLTGGRQNRAHRVYYHNCETKFCTWTTNIKPRIVQVSVRLIFGI